MIKLTCLNICVNKTNNKQDTSVVCSHRRLDTAVLLPVTTIVTGPVCVVVLQCALHEPLATPSNPIVRYCIVAYKYVCMYVYKYTVLCACTYVLYQDV